MKEEIAVRLIDLNRGFYQSFAGAFSDTRGRLQPGVVNLLDTLTMEERILDLGCGNGELAVELERRDFMGVYLGVDFSPEMLEIARSKVSSSNYAFHEADITQIEKLTAHSDDREIPSSPFDLVFAFAVLHHIPSEPLRLALTREIHAILVPQGIFELSNWNFMASDRMRARVVPWEEVGLGGADVDEGDYVLDWRREGRGLRYVHHFSEDELGQLAERSGFRVVGTSYSDGEGGRLGLYQTWVRVEND
jgi:SAM-dependent methyltransferase